MGKTPTPRHWVGFDLGGTKMLAQVFTDDFKSLGRERKKTRPQHAAASGLARISETIRGAIREAGLTAEDISGIGIGCPGPVDMDRGVLLSPPNLAWDTVDVGAALTKEFGCPVAVMNDVDAGVYGEYRFGSAKDSFCAVGVFPGTGIGGGCVYRGEILRGRSSSCMEIGHCHVVPNGPVCGCGQRGCLESVASRHAIAAAAARAALRGEAPHLLAETGTDIANIRSGALAEAIAHGDTVVADIVREAARLIGIAVSTVVNMLAADTIILGGGLVEAMPELFTTNVDRAARKRVMPAYRDAFQVIAAALGDDAAAIGAAAWARHVIHEKSSKGSG
ncbi:MAG: ROK family protein [Planctomyces sp.]|nr:ROK family protein [Planctomyces sp.]